LDKMPRQFQEKLLNFMESGRIKVDQMRKQYDFTIKGAKVFAAVKLHGYQNPCKYRPWKYRPELKTELKIAHLIGKAVWDQNGDIRDVISIGKLVRKSDGPVEVDQILSTMIKYGESIEK
jgi:hypothetical protein